MSTAPKPEKPKAKLPSKCPGCGASTSDNFNQKGSIARPGLHCHEQTTAMWAKFCGVVICATCGIGYHAHGHSTQRMQPQRRTA